MKNAALILTICLAGAASAGPVSLSGSNFLAVLNGGNLGAGFLYNVSPSQNEIDALMKFDLSPYSGDTISGGTLTITDLGLFHNINNGQVTDSLNTSLSVYSLSAPYNPNNAHLADVPYSNATLLDTESYSVPSNSSQVPLTFNISSALLAQWANAPSSNDGFIIVESTDYTFTGSGHSDLDWITSGPGAPVLSFNESAPSPEPATLLLIGPALAGICFLGSRKFRRP
jgi:hypothetical protein